MRAGIHVLRLRVYLSEWQIESVPGDEPRIRDLRFRSYLGVGRAAEAFESGTWRVNRPGGVLYRKGVSPGETPEDRLQNAMGDADKTLLELFKTPT